MASWTASTVVGTIFGSVIHVDTELVHFALTAMFIFMFMMQLSNGLLLATGLLSGGLAVVFMLVFKNTFGLILATLLASFTGYLIERIRKTANTNNDGPDHYDLTGGEVHHE